MLRFLVAAIILCSTPAAAQPVDEWLALPQDRDFLRIPSDSSEYTLRLIYVLDGEDIDSWTRKLTTWASRLPGRGTDDFTAYATGLYRDLQTECPGMTTSALRFSTWAGRRTAEFDAVCPLYRETGRPDIYIIRMIAGGSVTLTAGVAFRTPPTQAELTQAASWLDRLELCTPAAPEPACRATRALQPRSQASGTAPGSR